MPVATRSQISGGGDASILRTAIQKPSGLPRNPHHALKEKMKALTQFYEQHQHQLAAVKSLSSRTDLAELNSNKDEDGAIKKFPDLVESKENAEDRAAAFSCPKRELRSAARKLSLSGGPIAQSEPRVLKSRRISCDMGTISEVPGSRIMVYVRLRPLAKKEKEAGSRICVRIVNRQEIYLTELASDADYLRLKRLRGRHFSFDASFPESTSQQEVYATTAADLVEGVLNGRNGSVFCYGATGAGKTYTMLGTVENPGVMVLAIKDLFSKIRQRSHDGNHIVHLSYLEIYNETVRDLLSPGRPLVLREDKQGMIAAGLTQYRAYSPDEVMALLQQGNQNRTTEPTRANETSSRSHAILQVVAEYREKLPGGGIVARLGKLSLIDLAGSERALATDQRTLRSLEGANINRSLLALSSCISALVEGKKHVPYRNSKLTQLLKDSLGGACNTVMIANISPSSSSFGETQNTLHWADRAKQIKTKGCPESGDETRSIPETETDQAKLILELQRENSDLREQLAREKHKLLSLQAQFIAAENKNYKPALSPLTPQRTRKLSLLSAACFRTPDSKKRPPEEQPIVRELRQKVQTLETELEKMKQQHALQIKHKDSFIRELSVVNNRRKSLQGGGESERRIVTRASVRKLDLKSPSHRFISPAPAAKKRSFWDIAAANSPSVTAINGRKTKSHVAVDATPSLLLQPGFTRQRMATVKR